VSDPVLKRKDLYASVWAAIRALAKDAAPGSITPQTFARIATDVVLAELRKEGAINPVYARAFEGDSE
jgi:hypothetical protein